MEPSIEGNYDADAKKLLKKFKASALMMVILDGTKGNGAPVAVDVRKGTPGQYVQELAKVLRTIADKMEKDSDMNPGGER